MLSARQPRRPPADPLLRARDERIEALKSVIGRLSHDFNNFLAPQLGYVSLLKEDLPANSPSIAFANAIEAAARKAEKSLDSILLAVRPNRKYNPEHIDLASLITTTAAEWQRDLPLPNLSVSPSLEPAPLVADPVQWRRVLTQLLTNSAYALPKGGDIFITLRSALISPEEILRLGLHTTAVYQLTIRDTGTGIPPDIAERAFDPLFTTRQQTKAQGLGLSIAHAVTHLHGGQVELHSTPGSGTTVTIYLPRP